MTGPAVPVIDISGERGAVARAVARAVEEIGFLVVAGHRVPSATIEAMRMAARNSSPGPRNERPRSRTTRARSTGATRRSGRSSTARRGRTGPPPTSARASSTVPSTCRTIPITPRPRPGSPTRTISGRATTTGAVAAFKAYYRALEALNVELLGVFAEALGLKEGFFLDKFDRHASTVRVLHYPAQTEPPEEGQLRCGAHTDFGSHTILLADDSPGGLQVRGRAGGWIDVIPPADSFIVNIGD